MSAGVKFHKVHVFLDSSSAQHRLPHVGSEEVNDALKAIRFSLRFRPSFKINKEYDIPYLCGYDTKRDLAYFDKDFKPSFEGIDVSRFLLAHEQIEKELELAPQKWNYEQRHHIATHCERLLIEDAGIDWKAYTSWTTHAWHASYAKWKKPAGLSCPPTLDMSPYVDEHEGIISAMRKAGAKDSGHE